MSSKNRLTDGIPLRCGFFGQEFENIKSMTALKALALPALQILLFFIKCAILYIHFVLVNRLFVITYLAGISGQGFFLLFFSDSKKKLKILNRVFGATVPKIQGAVNPTPQPPAEMKRRGY